jgi:NitT/TauT family transport system substrate-binding protein
MTKRLFLAALVAVLPLSACSRRRSEPPPPKPIRIALLNYISYVQFRIAEQEGYFREQGLNVEFLPGASTNSLDVLPLLAQGQLDVYGGSVNAALFNAIARGSRIKVVADKGYVGEGDLYFTMMTRKDLVESGRLETPEGLRGLRIARTPGSSLQFYLETVLRRCGVAPEEVTMVATPNVMQQEALLNDAVDIVVAGEPFATRMLKTGKIVVWKPACEEMPGLQYSVLAYGKSLLTERRDEGRRFMTAYLKAVRDYNQGKTEKNVQYIVEFTGLEPELVREMAWPKLRDDGALDLQGLRDFQAWAVERGLADRVVNDDELCDLEFIPGAGRPLDAAGE